MKNFYSALGRFLGAAFALAALVFVGILLSTLWGALAGWIVGLFFGDTILGILSVFGITGFKMWQIGLFIGFVSSFFRTKVDFNKKD